MEDSHKKDEKDVKDEEIAVPRKDFEQLKKENEQLKEDLSLYTSISKAELSRRDSTGVFYLKERSNLAKETLGLPQESEIILDRMAKFIVARGIGEKEKKKQTREFWSKVILGLFLLPSRFFQKYLELYKR